MKISKDETRDMKDLFRWMKDMWKPAEPRPAYWNKFSGKSKTFKKNQRRGF